MRIEFKTIGLEGKYRELLGDPSPGFSAMIYGLPKNGKSSFSIALANHLATHHGKVLYCALEEGIGYTLKEKLERLEKDAPVSANLIMVDHIPDDISEYPFVFIDSVGEENMTADQVKQLIDDNPGSAFLFIYHARKDGNYRGEGKHAHKVDVLIKVEDFKAVAVGRFGSGEMDFKEYVAE